MAYITKRGSSYSVRYTCLLYTSNKGQRMMVIKGRGGEGKSQIGVVLSKLFGTNMKDGSICLLYTSRCV